MRLGIVKNIVCSVCLLLCALVSVSLFLYWCVHLYVFDMTSGDLLQLGEFSVLRFNHPHEAQKLREQKQNVSQCH